MFAPGMAGVALAFAIGATAPASAAPVEVPDDLSPSEEVRISFPAGRVRIGSTTHRFSNAEIDERSLVADFGAGTIKLALRDEEATGAVFVRLDDGRRFRGRIDGDETARLLRGRGRLVDARTGRRLPLRLTLPVRVIGAGTSTVHVRDGKAWLSGTLGARANKQIKAVVRRFPAVRTLVIVDSPGSEDDVVNMGTGRILRRAGFTTVVPRDGDAASGAVDLFAAGVRRVLEPGGRLRVHSWIDSSGLEGADLPRSHRAHRGQLRYFREMLGARGRGFYFFTLDAAPAAGIHVMTTAETERFGLVTGTELPDGR